MISNSQGKTKPAESVWLSELAIAHTEKPLFFSRKRKLINFLRSPKITPRILGIIFALIIFAGAINYVGIFSCVENASEQSIFMDRDNPTSLSIAGITYKTNPSAFSCNSGIFSWFSNRISSDAFSNLLSIHIGIGGVIVALLIFIAESMREETVIKSKVLIRDSWIFLLVILEIISLLMLPYLRWIIAIPDLLMLSIGLLALWSIYRTLLVFYDKKHYQREQKLYFLSLFDQVLQISALERVARNILIDKINKKELPFGTTIFSLDDKDEYYRFSFSREGIIQDINLQKLSELTLSLYGKKQLSNLEVGTEAKEISSQKTKPQVLLAKSLCDSVKISKGHSDDKTALLVHKTLLDNYGDKKNSMIAKIEKMIQAEGEIFCITPENSPEEEWEIIFADLKKLTKKAIEEEDEEEAVEAIKIYQALANELTDELQKISNLKYDYSGAIKERENGWFGGWGVIQALKDDTYDLVLDAVATKNKKIIGAVVYLSVLIVKDSIKKKDHYLFQEFIGVPTMLYLLARKPNNSEVQEFLFDRSWRYLKEICEYYIVSELRRKSGDTLLQYKSFSIFFIKVFQGLLKSSLDEKDFESFQHYLDTIYDLFENLDLHRIENEMQLVKWQLEKNPNAEKKIELDAQMDRLNTYKEIRDARRIMVFGIAAWTHGLWKPDNHQIYGSFLKALQDKILAEGGNETGKIVELTKLYLEAQKADDTFWGWLWWDTIPDGKVRASSTHYNFERFYLAEFLIILERCKEDIKKQTAVAAVDKLPASQSFEFMAQKNGSILNILDAIQTTGKLAPDIDLISQSSIEAVKAFLEVAKNKWEEEEEKQAIEKHTSEKKIEKFKDEVIKAFYKEVKLRKIFEYFDNFIAKTSEVPLEEPKNRFGINVVGDKEVFFDEWHVSYFDWGNNYGSDMAHGEDTEVFTKLRDKCKDGSLANLEKFLSRFTDIKKVIILATNSTIYDGLIDDNANFVPKWKEQKKVDIESYAGHYKFNGVNIPVFSMFTRIQQEEVLVLNTQKMGKFVQYSPINEGEESHQTNIFMMRIKAFSEHTDILDEFLKNPPEWLKKVSSSADLQKKHLLRKALIQLYERFRWETGEDFEGYKLS